MLKLCWMAGSIIGLLAGAFTGLLDLAEEHTGVPVNDKFLLIVRWCASIFGIIGLVSWFITLG